MRAKTGASVATVGLAVFASVALAAPAKNILVSRATGAHGKSAGAKSNNLNPTIALNGKLVAFQSDAKGLDKDADERFLNVYLRDTVANKLTLISRSDGSNGDAAGALSRNPALDPAGGFVAFESLADNLTINDDQGNYDVFVRNLKTGKVTVASHGPGAPGNADDPATSHTNCFDAAVSQGAKLVAFRCRGPLVPEDTNSVADVYVRDVVHNTTALVSRASGGAGAAADGGGTEPSISVNGRFVVFRSRSTNLGSSSPFPQIYRRDLKTGKTVLISRASGPNGAAAVGGASHPVVDDLGDVAFDSIAKNLSSAGKGAIANVFLRVAKTQKTVLISAPGTTGGAGVAGGSRRPSISINGAHIAFESDADNISALDDNDVVQVFWRDTVKNTTRYVSRSASGKAGSGGEGEISANGAAVAFTSAFPKTSTEDNDKALSNVFVRHVGNT